MLLLYDWPCRLKVVYWVPSVTFVFNANTTQLQSSHEQEHTLPELITFFTKNPKRVLFPTIVHSLVVCFQTKIVRYQSCEVEINF